MNRPLKRKLENAVLAYLDANKTGTTIESLTIVSGHGTDLAAEIAIAADPAATPAVTEPDMPYLAIFVQTRAEPGMPNNFAYELVAHYKHDATAPDQTRAAADDVLRDVHDLLTCPPTEADLTEDSNPEAGAFRAFANIVSVGSDTREVWRKPLHVYSLFPTSELTLFDEFAWHDQIAFAGHAQDINPRDSE